MAVDSCVLLDLGLKNCVRVSLKQTDKTIFNQVLEIKNTGDVWQTNKEEEYNRSLLRK